MRCWCRSSDIENDVGAFEMICENSRRNVIASTVLKPWIRYKHLSLKHLEAMTNYDKSPTQTWKRPTTWNPSPQKCFFSSPLFRGVLRQHD